MLSLGGAKAQQPSPAMLPKVIPPSPDASSLGKYGEIPVSLFTGTASVNIPLFELQSKTLSMPISLSYHGSGVKVEEYASWVGTGWSLNAGGVITRSIRGGFPDEEVNGILNNNLPTATELIDPLVARNYAPSGSMDSEPDAYFYNFNGRSGQLIFDENGNFYPTTADKLRFTNTVNNSAYWIAVDEQGTTYIFSNIEYTHIDTYPVPTAWYLSKVISADGSDFIDLTYAPKEETTYVPSAENFVWHNSDMQLTSAEESIPSGETGFQGNYMTGTYVTGHTTLSEISSKKGKVKIETTGNRTDFAGAREVSNIKVLDSNDQLLKTYQFSYTDYDRLFLTSVQEVASNGKVKPAHIFSYFDVNGLPSRTSKSQDFWGYFNGRFSSTLIPYLPSDFPLPSGILLADRTSSSGVITKGTLESITYPTGGKTVFEYELNEFENGVSDLSKPIDVMVSTINDGTATSPAHTPNNRNGRITIGFNSFREEDNYPRPVVRLQKYENGAWTTPLGYIWQIPYPSMEDTYFDVNLTLDLGAQYRVMITTEGCPNPPCNTPQPSPDHYTTEVHFYVFEDAGIINQGGGIRVKAIRDYESSESPAPTSVRKFEYYNGILVTVPIYFRSYNRTVCKTKHPIAAECIEFLNVKFYTASSQSLVNLGTCQGGLVVYPYVKEIYGENGENGYTMNYFMASASLGYSGLATVAPFLPRENTDFYDGKRWKQTIHLDNGQILKENWSLYSSPGPTINFNRSTGLKVMQSRYPSAYSDPLQDTEFVHGYYHINSQWVYLDSTRDVSYFDGAAPVVIATKYIYSNPNHIQPTTTRTYSSENKLVETRTAYAHDSPSETEMTSTVLSNLQVKNMIIPLKSETWVNGVRKGGSITNFNTWSDGSLRPSSVQILAGTEYEPRLNYYSYSDGNVETVSKVDDFKVSYLWGYNNALPIAEVKNTEVGAISANFSTTHYANEDITTNTSTDTPLGAPFQVFSNQTIAPTATVAIMGSNGPPSPTLTLILKQSNGTPIKTHSCVWGSNPIGSITLVPGTYQWYYSAVVDPGNGFNGYDLDITTPYTGQRTGYRTFHTSFEENGVSDPGSKTGSKVWSGVYELTLPGQNGVYKLTYWQRTGSNPWALVEETVTVTSGTVGVMNIGSASAVIDELRLLPPGATMTTYTYKPMLGITSVTDENQITTYYDYDEFGRLETILDQNKNILKGFTYHYIGEE